MWEFVLIYSVFVCMAWWPFRSSVSSPTGGPE